MIALYLSMLEQPEHEVAFTAFYEEHLPMLTRVGHKYFPKSWLINDALQEAWMRIAKKFTKILGLSCHESKYYIVTIMKNCCKTLLRKEHPYAEIFPDEDALLDDIAEGATISMEGYRHIVHLISTLPGLYREVMERKLVLEQTNQEMAHDMKISSNLVAQRLVRGRKLLIEALRKEEANID